MARGAGPIRSAATGAGEAKPERARHGGIENVTVEGGSRRLRAGPGVRRDGDAFVAEGVDPQMFWAPGRTEAAALVRRSAVRVTVRMHAVEGRLIEPCVYVDWGDGFTEATRKTLIMVGTNVYAATAHSNAGACRRIRFDPSCRSCRFVVEAWSVTAASAPSPSMHRIGAAWSLGRRVLRRLPPPLQHGLRTTRALALRRPVRTLEPGAWPSVRGPDRWRGGWEHAFAVARNARSPHFAAPPTEPPARNPDGPRVVAFYLPQYHPIPENDAWWSRGFTEWTNVSKATPQFAGHLQPKLPADFGFYDLRVPEVQRAQVELARLTGVDAFCFHYYWFAGRRLLERPLDAFLADPALDFPFCLSWANENWTRRWDGDENDILVGQEHSPEDDHAVLTDVARYMRSPRYLRVGGRPLLVVYRPDILPDAGATVARWRAGARALGLGELFLLCTTAFGFDQYRASGFDGVVEFPPHALASGEITAAVERLNPAYDGRVYDYPAVVEERVAALEEREDARHFPGVMPAWDNEARKPGGGNVFHDAEPETFLRWTVAAMACSSRLSAPGERLVFVNAWNEWAEGAYLEPDRWFGHGFAQAVRAAHEAQAPRLAPDLAETDASPPRRHDAIAIAHVYYPDLIDEFAGVLEPLTDKMDLAVTFPDVWSPEAFARLRRALPTATLSPTPNRGRDVRPFLKTLAWARGRGYRVFCKIHSKRSPHIPDGEAWRRRSLAALAGPSSAGRALAAFDADPKLGLVAAASDRMMLGEPGVLANNRETLEALARRFGFRCSDTTEFVAGTMFWGRTAAFARLADAAADLEFEPELGRIDGTLAHALERAMAAVVTSSGFTLRWLA